MARVQPRIVCCFFVPIVVRDGAVAFLRRAFSSVLMKFSYICAVSVKLLDVTTGIFTDEATGHFLCRPIILFVRIVLLADACAEGRASQEGR